MKLARYLEITRKTGEQFAEEAGVSQSTISRLLKRGQQPTIATMQRIAEATNGRVRPRDWFNGHAV